MNITPLRYAGGKTKAIKYILPHIPNDVKEIISPFIGGGSLEVELTNLGKKVYGHDIFKPLVIFWNVMKYDNSNLVSFLESIEPTKEKYNEIKEILIKWKYTQEILSEWKTEYYKRDPIQLSNLEIAGYYFFNHNTSYGPGYLGWPSSVYLNEQKWRSMINNVKKFKSDNLQVFCMPFDILLPEVQDAFLYLDPPYYLNNDTDNKMFTGIYPMRNIPVHHENFNHELLRDLLHCHKGKFILSYNNCETIREYYKDFRQEFPSWNYSMGNGETRIGKNRINDGNSNSKQSHEILIIKD